MPQLLKLAGYKSYWFSRGVHGVNTPSEFLWQGIDGSRIAAIWLPQSYGLFYPAPRSLFEFERYTRQIWETLGQFSRSSDRVALAGADVIEPEEALPLMVSEFNRKSDAPLVLRFGVPTDFETAVGNESGWPVITG
jgi:alpha-mannosidase